MRALKFLGVMGGALLALAIFATLHTPGHLWIKTGVFAGCPARPSCVSSQAEDESHRVPPLKAEVSRELLRQRLETLLLRDPRLHIAQATPEYLHAVITSPPGLRDDLELLIGNGVVEVRSLSRFGFDDGGANRARVEALRRDLTALPGTLIESDVELKASPAVTFNARINNLLDRDFTTYRAEFRDLNNDGDYLDTVSVPGAGNIAEALFYDDYNNKDKARNFWLGVNVKF